MKEQTDRALSPPNRAAEYYYRRPLSARELRPAVRAGLGVAIVTGLAVFYVTRLLLQRTPLLSQPPRPTGHPASRRVTW